jgi:hypothetical protein
MGVGYSRPITQWSKGEYTTANNTQDDLTIITQNGVSYRGDDFGNTTGTAAVLTGSAPATNGVIERATDVDFFRFDTGSGPATLSVAPASPGANLHLFVTVYDSLGATLTNREVADMSGGVQTVAISRTLTTGTYFLSVEGRGSGNPVTTGYSDYASLGQYTLNLSLPAVTVVAARPLLTVSRPTGSMLPLQFLSQSNRSYVLQAATNLDHPVWQSISTNIGTGGPMSISVPFNANMRQRLWRLKVN